MLYIVCCEYYDYTLNNNFETNNLEREVMIDMKMRIVIDTPMAYMYWNVLEMLTWHVMVMLAAMARKKEFL